MPVSIGVIQGSLELRVSDALANLTKFTARLDQFESRLKKVEESTARVGSKTKSETDKAAEAYKKLTGALDPVVAGHHKYEQAQRTLQAALSKGIITQSEYSKQLALAKSRYLDAEHGGNKFHTLLEKITKIASVSGGAGREAAEAIESVTIKASSLGAAISSLGPLIPIVMGLAAAVVGVGVAFKALEFATEFIADSVKEGMKVQVVIEQLNNSLRQNGAAAGYSAEQLIKQAEALVTVSGRTDEAITAGELILTRFSKIGHDVFPQATKAALDFAQATGRDLPSAFTAVGKLLQDAGRGLNAFKEVGITLLPSQRKTLQALLETGKVAEYQALVLDILKEKVGGAAEAYSKTLAGGIDVAKAEFGEFQETIGSEVIPALELLMKNVLDSVGGWEHLHATIQVIAHEIGNAVRLMVEGAILSYHEWRAEQQLTVANLAEGLRDFVSGALESFATLAEGFSLLPGGAAFRPVIANLRALQAASAISLTVVAANARKSANEQVAAAAKTVAAIKEHKLALEGDTKVYPKLNDALDSVARKEDEHTKRIKDSIAALKADADNAVKRFKLVGATDAELLKQEIAEARLAAAQKLGAGATAAQIELAQDYAEKAAIAAHATENWKKELEALDKASSNRVNAQFNRNAELIAKDPYKEGLAPSPFIINNIMQKVKAAAEDFAQGIRASLVSIADTYEREKTRIKHLIDLGPEIGLTAQEGAEAIRRIERQRWNDALSLADQSLGYLADRLGGFFSSLQRAVNALQGARGFGQGLEQLASSNRYTANYASAIGQVGTVFAIYYEVYKAVSDYVKKHQQRRFQVPVSFTLQGGQELHSFFDSAGNQVVSGIRSMVRQIESAIGALVTDLPEIAIKIRNDGKKFRAYLSGVLLGEFNTAAEATEAAMLAAIRDTRTRFSGLSELMRQGLQVHMPDVSELTNFLSQLREISNLQLPQGAIQLRETVLHLDQLWQALARVRQVTPEVIQGFNDISTSVVQSFLSWRRSITGAQESPAEIRARIEAEMRVFNAEKVLKIADLKMREFTLRQEADQLRVRAQIIDTGNRIGGIILRIQGEELKVRIKYAEVSKTIVQTQLELLEVQIEAINKLIAELEAIPDIKLPEIKFPGVGRGATGVGDPTESARALILEATRSTMNEYARALLEIDDKYKKAGESIKKNSTLLTELAHARQLEIDALRQRVRTDLLGMIQSSGVKEIQDAMHAFDDFRNLPKDIRPPKWLIDLVEGKWRERTAVNLDTQIGSLMGVNDSAAALNLRLQDLREQVIAFGGDAADVTRRLHDIDVGGQYVRQTAINSILDRVFSDLKDNAKYSKESLQFAKQKVQLEYTVIRAQLAAWNALTPALSKLIDDAEQSAINAANSGTSLHDTIAERLAERQQQAADALKEAADKFAETIKSLKAFRDSLLLDKNLTILKPEQQAQEALRRYQEVYTKAAGGDLTARADFEKIARQSLDVYRSVYGSSTPYVDFFSRVQTDLEKLISATTFTVPGTSNVTAIATSFQNLTQQTTRIADKAESQRSEIIDQLKDLSAPNQQVRANASTVANLASIEGNRASSSGTRDSLLSDPRVQASMLNKLYGIEQLPEMMHDQLDELTGIKLAIIQLNSAINRATRPAA